MGKTTSKPLKSIEIKVIDAIDKAIVNAAKFNLNHKDHCYRVVLVKNGILTPVHLINRILKVKNQNKNITPYFDNNTCKTCGTKGLSHPTTSYCLICDTDNW